MTRVWASKPATCIVATLAAKLFYLNFTSFLPYYPFCSGVQSSIPRCTHLCPLLRVTVPSSLFFKTLTMLSKVSPFQFVWCFLMIRFRWCIFLGRRPKQWYCVLLGASYWGCWLPIYLISDAVNLGHLNKVASVRFSN